MLYRFRKAKSFIVSVPVGVVVVGVDVVDLERARDAFDVSNVGVGRVVTINECVRRKRGDNVV